MPDKEEQHRPETEPDEEPQPAPGPVEQDPPEQEGPEPEPLVVEPEPEAPPPEAPDVEPEPVELPDEEPEPVDVPDEKPEPDPRLVEVIQEHDRRVASLERDLREVMDHLPEPAPDDFFARSEPAPDPHQMVRPVGIRGGDGIDALFTPDGGSMSAAVSIRPFTSIPISENIEWGIAAIPENRPSGDSCAWMRPATDGHYGYCYVEPCDPPTSHEWTYPTGPTVTTENQKGLVKVVFWGAGYRRAVEPNVRYGDLVPFMRIGAIALGMGHLDRPLGTVNMAFNQTVTAAGVPDGWFLMTNESAICMPNTNVTTLGTEVTNTNVQQTLLVAAGNQDWPGAEEDEYPIYRVVSSVDVATYWSEITPDGIVFATRDVYGSYFVPAQRIN